MASVMESDLIDGSGGELTGEGSKFVRVFMVEGLAGDRARRAVDALTASGLPAIHEPHPFVGNLFVRTKTVEFLDQEQARVTVTYDGPPQEGNTSQDLPKISVGSAVQAVDTNKDVDGATMTVSFLDPAAAAGTAPDVQGGTVSVQVPVVSLAFEVIEVEAPVAKAVLFGGTINSSEIWGFPAGTLLCTGITGQSDDGGRTYQVSYQFQFSQTGWDAVVYWIDPATGRPSPDSEPYTTEKAEGNGWRRYVIYRSRDFHELGLKVQVA